MMKLDALRRFGHILSVDEGQDAGGIDATEAQNPETLTTEATPTEEPTAEAEDTTTEEEAPQEKLFTQEELDKKIQARLDRQAKKHEEALEELRSSLTSHDESQSNLQKQLEEAQAATAAAELKALRIAAVYRAGLTEDALEFIKGDTDEEITASIEKLQSLTGKKTVTIEPKDYAGEAKSGAGHDHFYRSLLNKN